MVLRRFIPRPIPDVLIQWQGDLSEVHLYSGVVQGTVLPDGSLDLRDDGLTIVPVDGYLYPVAGYVVDQAFIDQTYQPLPSGNPAYAFTADIPEPIVLEHRVKIVDVPALSLGAATTITVAWPTAMLNSSYSVTIVPCGAASYVGSLQWVLVEGSLTASGCQLRVKAPLLGLSLGAMKLQVRADSL